MAQVGKPRYIYFRVADIDGNAVIGLTLSDFAVTFLRDDVSSTDPVTFHEIGGGLYSLHYTPSAEGNDYLELYNADNDLRTSDAEIIGPDVTGMAGSSLLTTLDENYRPALRPSGIGDLSAYTLYVFPSADWEAGVRDAVFAVGDTTLNADGSWRCKLPVMSGIYHVVLMSSSQTRVLAAFLTV